MLGARVAYATPTATCGCAADRFDPPAVGAGAFAADTLSSFSGSAHAALGSVTAGGYNPLVIYNANGSIRAEIIKYQLIQAFGGSYVFLGGHLRLSFNVPFLLQYGEAGSLDGVQYKAPPFYPVLGDIRFAADYKIVGKGEKSPFHLAAGLEGSIPTGSPDNYSGIGTTQLIPKLLVAGSVGSLRVDAFKLKYAARVSMELRPAVTLTPDVLDFGFVFGLQIKKTFTLNAEFSGTTVASNGALFKSDQTPVEGMVAFHYFGEKIRFGAGFGPGTQGLGSPLARIIFNIEFVTPPPKLYPKPSDRDGDGVSDARDACPDVPGVATNDPATNGCPKDTDGDGIPDKEDACPNDAGLHTDDPATNGCPDRDGDGIPDKLDACPDVPGVASDDPKTNGCPPPPPAPTDQDNDGIPDNEDACPTEPGPRNSDPKKNGCPEAKVVEQEIKQLPPIGFVVGTAQLTKESQPTLEEIARTLAARPNLVLHIEGHTDDVGTAAYNLVLSQRRADSVRVALLKFKVNPAQLSAEGFGATRPIAPNTTPDGRAKNRRVELHIEVKK